MLQASVLFVAKAFTVCRAHAVHVCAACAAIFRYSCGTLHKDAEAESVSKTLTVRFAIRQAIAWHRPST